MRLTKKEIKAGVYVVCSTSNQTGSYSLYTQGSIYKILEVKKTLDECTKTPNVLMTDDTGKEHHWCVESLTGYTKDGNFSKDFLNYQIQFSASIVDQEICKFKEDNEAA
jgi:hypothetical protein